MVLCYHTVNTLEKFPEDMKAYDLDTTWMASYNKAMKAKEMFDSLQQE